MGYMKEYYQRCMDAQRDPEQWQDDIIAEIQAEREQHEQKHQRMKRSMGIIHTMEHEAEQSELHAQITGDVKEYNDWHDLTEPDENESYIDEVTADLL